MTVSPSQQPRMSTPRILAAGGVLLVLFAAAHLLLVRSRTPAPIPLELVAVLGMVAAAFAIAAAVRHVERSRDVAHLAEATRRAEREGADATLARLATVIDRQFDAWALTPTEREIARLLLQGETHKNVAKQTGRSERTVRQHAVEIYHKSGLHSRAELAGYFLDRLVLSPPSSDLEG